jgi:hypothetical protein
LCDGKQKDRQIGWNGLQQKFGLNSEEVLKQRDLEAESFETPIKVMP